jgi:alanine racemase
MVLLRSSATTAVISRSALESAAHAAAASGGSVADLRRDAYGHGLLAVARAAHDAGIRTMLVDGADQISLLGDAGIDATDRGEVDVPVDVLYGLNPGARPVMRLTGHVMSLKDLQPGDAVSYGYTYRAQCATTVALITGGYAQAVVRLLGNRMDVEISGALHPIVGRVAMDVCVIEVGDAAGIREGSEVTFFGGSGPARDAIGRWSAVTGLGPLELVCAAGLAATQAEED